MIYEGYKSKEEIIAQIDCAFPFVLKPVSQHLLKYSDSDIPCKCIREHIQDQTGTKISLEGIRYIHDELANFTSEGMAWVMPNLLRFVMSCSDSLDRLTECIIWDLELVEDSPEVHAPRYSCFNEEQLRCINLVLEHLSEQHGHVIVTSQNAINRLMHNKSSHSAS